MPISLRPSGGVFSSELLEERPGFVSILFEGENAAAIFAHESGGHRWQRIPPTEKRGRYQTSTVTVAVLAPSEGGNGLRESDIDFRYTIGDGPGGQHRQKNATCVIATHRPTGISVRIDTRSQHRNKQIAVKVLAARVAELEQSRQHVAENESRKKQLGTGMRGDKIRTYRTQNNRVTDHRTNRKMPLSRWLKGEWEQLT